jgi:hypothetical protein
MSAERAERAPHLDLVEAARRFFREDGSRILTVASGLRAPDRTIESTVQGPSMGRAIPAGSRIRIELGVQRSYDPGEVIAFVAGPHVIVHRVLTPARRGQVLTRGDAEVIPDPPIDADQILGAVTAIQRGGNWAPVERRSSQSFPVRVLASILLATIACSLYANPRAAAVQVRLLRKGRTFLSILRRTAWSVR